MKASTTFDPAALDVDMRGKTVVITGANTGIGYAVAEALASKHAEVHMLCRDTSRGEAAIEKMKKTIGADVDFDLDLTLHTVDVSNMTSIKNFAEKWKESEKPIHVLVNNAGCMVHHENKWENSENQNTNKNAVSDLSSKPQRWNMGNRNRGMSADGYEINFATNTLGTYALTKLLEPVLVASLKKDSAHGVPVRVITVSSGGMLTEPLEINDLEAKNMKYVLSFVLNIIN